MATRSTPQSHANSKLIRRVGQPLGQNHAARRQARRVGWPFTCFLGTIFFTLALCSQSLAQWSDNAPGYVSYTINGIAVFNDAGGPHFRNFTSGQELFGQAAIDAAYSWDQGAWGDVWAYAESLGTYSNPAAPGGPAASIGEIVTDGLSMWETVKGTTLLVLTFLICASIARLTVKIFK